MSIMPRVYPKESQCNRWWIALTRQNSMNYSQTLLKSQQTGMLALIVNGSYIYGNISSKHLMWIVFIDIYNLSGWIATTTFFLKPHNVHLSRVL